MSEDRDDIADSDAQSRCCSYCRLPPRAPGKKLRRCSRCRRAWYHDAECQKRHFPLHKRDCQTWHAERLRTARTAQGNGTTATSTIPTTTTSTTTSTSTTTRKHERRSPPVPSASPPLFVVEQREGRGKCLVASPGTTLRRGDRIADSRTSRRDAWDPLVPPVLLEEFRASRCALCFSRLAPRSSGGDRYESCSFEGSAPESSPYRLSFCSAACRGAAAERGMEQEERDAFALWKKSNERGPPRIFATAILLYRILVMEEQSQLQQSQQSQSDASALDQLRDLQSKPRRGTSDADAHADADAATDDDQSEERRYHTQGVIATAMGMLRCSESPALSSCRPSMEHLVDTVHKIKINGFSITYEEDLERIGVGLYGIPSFMNHSCRPNALQTFSLERARLPSLTVTAFRDIAPGAEICISYTDASCPSRVRRKRLENDYGFVCFCEACDTRSGRQDDSRTLALSCCQSGGRSRSTVVRTDEGAEPSGRPRYECTECGRTDFGSALRRIGEFEAELLSESIGGDGSAPRNQRQQQRQQQRQRQRQRQRQLTDAYQALKRLCQAESWYVRQAGDRLLQHHLAKLPGLANDPTRERAAAAAALAVAEELLLPNDDDSASESSTSAFLQRQQLLYKTAKLRLFLFPDPRRSIGELQQVLGALEPCFARDHALIVGLKACLAGAMM